MRSTVIVVAGGLAVATASARADTHSWHALLDGDVAATDNVFSVPSGGLGATPREADVYFQVRPGVLFAYDSPRMIQELEAQVDVLAYVRNYGTPSTTFRGSWRASYQPNARTEILTVATGSTGQLNALTARTSPDETTIQVQPGGTVDVDEAGGSERVAYQTSEATRLTESATADYTQTDDHAGTTVDSLSTMASLAFDRLWRSSSLGGDLGAAYLRFDRSGVVTTDPLQFGNDHQIDPHLYVTGRHDFSRHWTGNVTAGGVLVIPTESGRTTQPFAVASGQVAYTDDWGAAALQGGRTVAPNMFIAESSVVEGITATVNLPLPWLRPTGELPRLFAQASAGLSRTQLIDSVSGELVSSIDLARADIGVTWLARPGMTFGVRYEFMHQTGDATATLLLPAFTRDTVFLTFSVRWPDRVAASIPRHAGMRADGADGRAIGDEPVVPDVAAPAANGTSNGGPGPTP